MTDFFTNLCLCHSLIIEEDESYQGPSPDEVALVDAARQLGFEFKKRAQGKLTLSLLGKEVEYEILNVMEYSSDRGCMSVIARTPDGSVRLYCKGSDTKVMAKIRKGTNEKLLDHTNQNLYTFACEGLRTLVLGTKLIPEREYAEWDRRYQEVGVAFIDRARPRTQLGRTRPNSTELDRDVCSYTAASHSPSLALPHSPPLALVHSPGFVPVRGARGRARRARSRDRDGPRWVLISTDDTRSLFARPDPRCSRSPRCAPRPPLRHHTALPPSHPFVLSFVRFARQSSSASRPSRTSSSRGCRPPSRRSSTPAFASG